MSASLKVKVWAVAGLTALTLLHHSECSSVTDDGMRAVAISLTHIESAGTPACAREGGALEGDEGCTTRWCSVGAGRAALGLGLGFGLGLVLQRSRLSLLRSLRTAV